MRVCLLVGNNALAILSKSEILLSSKKNFFIINALPPLHQWVWCYQVCLKMKLASVWKNFTSVFLFIFLNINSKKYCFRKNLQLPVFNKFTRFVTSWAWFYYFRKVSVFVFACDRIFCDACSSKTDAQNFIKLSVSFFCGNHSKGALMFCFF